MLTVVLAVLTVVGFVIGLLAFVDARRSKRIKRLCWEHAGATSLASVVREGKYKLSILYESDGKRPQIVRDAFLSYVRLANLGQEPIRRDDIATGNPLQLRVDMEESDEVVLDMSLSDVTRDVNQLRVHEVQNTDTDTGATATIDFEYLDYKDGGIIRILSSGKPADVSVTGDVIGMPGGIARSDMPGPFPTKTGVWLWIVAEIAAMALTVVLYQRVTGSWTDAWLLAVPFAVFVLVLLIAFALTVIWLHRKSESFPIELAFPKWFQYRMIELAAPRVDREFDPPTADVPADPS